MDKKVTKTAISKEDVFYVSGLSRLKIDVSKIDQFQSQLSDILGYIDQLNELDTENISPTSHVITSIKNVFRDDEPEESITPEQALQNAPDKENNFFKVTRIIQET